jgi:heme-degrading monooxygenase HmoA
MSEATRQPAIARIWRGRTRPERADEYEAYNYEVGIKPLIKHAMGVQTFREDREGETEFITISYWESIEAMTVFAGSDPTAIHHLDRDAEFLIELPKSVQIVQLRTSHGRLG